MMSSLNWFLWNSNANLPREYLSGMPNFILIGHHGADIHSKEVNRELWKKWILRHCDLDLQSKVTNFYAVQTCAVINYLAKTALPNWCIRSVVILINTDRHTNRHQHTDKLPWKYNPSTILWIIDTAVKKYIDIRLLFEGEND